MMEQVKENSLTQVSKVDFVRVISGGSSSIIIPSTLLRVAGGMMRDMLPASDTNIVGNYEGNGSGFGWYNNTHDSKGEYAPANTAGIFIRFNAITQVTFFFPTAAGESKLWYRIDGGKCIKL